MNLSPNGMPLQPRCKRGHESHLRESLLMFEVLRRRAMSPRWKCGRCHLVPFVTTCPLSKLLVFGLYSDRRRLRNLSLCSASSSRRQGWRAFRWPRTRGTWPSGVSWGVGLADARELRCATVLVIEATTPETYGRAFGLERSMDTVGCGRRDRRSWPSDTWRPSAFARCSP